MNKLKITAPNKLRLEIEEEIKRLDPKLKAESMEFQAAAVLLASAVVGADARRIAHLMQYPAGIVGIFETSLRRNGIWDHEKVRADWSGENGGAEFWLDVCVAMGWMSVVNRRAKPRKPS